MLRTRSSRTATFAALVAATAALVAATAILAIASTALAVDFGPKQILRIAPEDTPLLVRDISAAGDSIAVVWNEESAGASQAFIRWSHDGGQTFAEHHMWNGVEPQLDTCKDGKTFAIYAYPRAVGRGVGVSLEYGDEFMGTGIRWVSADALARHPDIACVGDSAPAYTLAAAWLDQSTSPARVKVKVRVFRDYFCHDCGVPGKFGLDLGPGRVSRGLSIAATGRHIYVAWVRGQAMRLQRFSVTGSDASLEVTAEPAVTLLTSRYDAGQPHLAAVGHRVVLAYQNEGETRLTISDDRGLHFGPWMVIGEPAFEVGGTSPTSVDARGGQILVEQSGSFGEGPKGGVHYSRGFLSTDGGESWSETSSHSDGGSVGALFAVSGTPMVAEAWDKSLTEGPTSRKLRFHSGPT